MWQCSLVLPSVSEAARPGRVRRKLPPVFGGGAGGASPELIERGAKKKEVCSSIVSLHRDASKASIQLFQSGSLIHITGAPNRGHSPHTLDSSLYNHTASGL